jgi:DNA-binding response OmpR family regulator
LLTNAFKFTPNGGSISIDITTSQNDETKNILISIKDSGIGIPKESQEKIFDRFYQVDNSSKRNFGGSGIGLSLVKELVSLHNWNIEVKSRENMGTEFILTIPVSENTSENNIYNNNDIKSAAYSDKKEKVFRLNDVSLTSDNSEKPVVLVVEDSEDVRTYVSDILRSDYDVLLAESGEMGLEVTINNQPDLIISDVMMPGMDGFEFCKRIKSDWKTSHIPIILLTAKAAHQNKLEGLELGADDYITKPFDYKELLIRIKNLIDQRKKLKEKFGKDINTKAEMFSENSSDKEFIQKTIDVIEKNIHNEKFDSETLAKELYVSRSQLNRKLHAITGQGPGEFLRIYKLKRGAQMIMENKLSITQIAYEIGFGSPAQFTRAFQKYFKYLPSEFHKQFETKG